MADEIEFLIEIEGDNYLVISIPLEMLNSMQKSRQDIPLEITDFNKMGKWLNDNILKSKRNITSESDFELFFNNIFTYAYEHAEAWLRGYIKNTERPKKNQKKGIF